MPSEREGLTRRGIRLEFTPALIEYMVAIGFSPKYGARPLQRAVERHVVGALSRLLIDQPLENVTLLCDYDGAVQILVA